MLSCNPAGASTISNGENAGLTLTKALFSTLDGICGSVRPISAFFPLLIKLIDAKERLSIQVHPDNAYAFEHDGGFGKTEMWYVLEAIEGATICNGFARPVTKDEFRKRIEDNTLLEVLNQVPVKKGDAFLIKAGTIHSISAGVVIAEIQQNANTTYRVYDYDRKDANGNSRDLHIEEAIAVTDTSSSTGLPSIAVYSQQDGYFMACLASCAYFTVYHFRIDTHAVLYCETSSFQSLIVISGSALIRFSDSLEKIDARKGMSLFIPAGMGEYRIDGECEILLTKK